MNIDYACGGALRSDCPWYVPRREDALIFNQLAHGNSCYIRTLHQMGKSSLLVRLAGAFKHSGLSTAVSIDLSALGCGLNDLQWYNGLILRIGRQLQLEDEFDDFWHAESAARPVQRFVEVLDQVALRGRPGAIVVLIDEADLVRSLPFSADDLLRCVQTAASRRGLDGSGFNRLVFCLFGTAAPDELWRNPGQQSLHLGKVIGLRDFAHDELLATVPSWADYLLERVKLPQRTWTGPARGAVTEVLQRVFYWTNGHPYLTQKLGCASAACVGRQLARGTHVTAHFCHRMVDHFTEVLFTGGRAREQDCHLLWVQHQLAECNADGELAEPLLRVLHGRGSPLSPDPRLVRCGLLRLNGDKVCWRNRIYERVLTDPWPGNGLPTVALPACSGRVRPRSTVDPPGGGLNRTFEASPWRAEAELCEADTLVKVT